MSLLKTSGSAVPVACLVCVQVCAVCRYVCVSLSVYVFSKTFLDSDLLPVFTKGCTDASGVVWP